MTLVPAQSLEDGLLGATRVVRGKDGQRVPTSIRVATRTRGQGAESLREVAQHEIGHAISVLRHQDTSEEAAEQYALDH